MDVKSGVSALLSISFMVLWPDVFSQSVSSSTSVSTGQEERPRVARRSTLDCDTTFDNYCLNNGQCMMLVDISEHHCKCEPGFYGPRCSNVELVTQPVAEGQIVAIVFCMSLLLIGLAGALYFFYKWYKKNRATTKSGLRQLPVFYGSFTAASAQTRVLVGSRHHANVDQHKHTSVRGDGCCSVDSVESPHK